MRLMRFNPRAREGRDLPDSLYLLRASGFNPRAREGRDLVQRGQACQCWRFNPRAREGRDIERMLAIRVSTVSIHAPARSDGWGISRRLFLPCFNPRAREGRDSWGFIPKNSKSLGLVLRRPPGFALTRSGHLALLAEIIYHFSKLARPRRHGVFRRAWGSRQENSKNQWPFRVIRSLGSHMLHPTAPVQLVNLPSFCYHLPSSLASSFPDLRSSSTLIVRDFQVASSSFPN